MNVRPLPEAQGLQEDAVQALADGLRAQTDEVQGRPREAETHLEHLAITHKTVVGLADRLPTSPPEPPEHPDYPSILAVLNEAISLLRPGLRPRSTPEERRRHRAKLKRLVKLDILTEADTGNFARKQEPAPRPVPRPQAEVPTKNEDPRVTECAKES